MSEETQLEVEETPVQDVETSELQDSGQIDNQEEAITSDTDDSSAEQPKKSKGVQKRIDELTALRYDAERDRDYWRDLALKSQQQPQQPETQAQTPQKPTEDDFDSYEDYLIELGKWGAKRELEEQQSKAKQYEAQAKQQQLAQSFAEKEAAYRANHPDYDRVARDPYLPVTDAMAEAIASSDNGPEVLHHLGNNRNEAARIANLSPYQQVRELTLLEARLTAKPEPKQTSAPEPISPVGGNQPAQADPSKMSIEEWMNWRNSQIN